MDVQLLKKFHLSSPKGQEGWGRSIETAVIQSGLQPQPTPKSLPKKLPAAQPGGPGAGTEASGRAGPTPARAS